jgi:RNA polymerase sigma factor (TIGR02999 family)
MPSSLREEVTEILVQAEGAEAPPALDRLIPLVYDELRLMAAQRLRSDGSDLTLTPTELVHEVYVRLADATRITARGRAYFFASAARAMRRVIVDHARRRGRQKRGGGERPVTFHDAVALSGGPQVDVLDLERGLDQLSELAARSVRVVECRFYGGLSVEDTAVTLGVTPRTVNRDWQFARAWLFDYLNTGHSDGTHAE